MMPDNALSDPVPAGVIFPPDDRPFSPRQDFDLGGVAHQDPSQGLMVKVWKAWIDSAFRIWVQPEDQSQPAIFVATAPNAVYISLAFDRNARMTVAWRQGSTVYLYWFDTVTNQFITSMFPGARSPRLTHDDKRPEAALSSDVLLFYIQNDVLYVRNQRDRYTVAHELGPVPRNANLTRVGMASNLRLAIEYQ